MLQRKYAIFCPHCRNELNWFETSFGSGITTEYLKCVTCDLFYINDSVLSETDVPKKRIEHFKKQGFNDEGYQGGPTSSCYQPKWLRSIERLFM